MSVSEILSPSGGIRLVKLSAGQVRGHSTYQKNFIAHLRRYKHNYTVVSLGLTTQCLSSIIWLWICLEWFTHLSPCESLLPHLWPNYTVSGVVSWKLTDTTMLLFIKTQELQMTWQTVPLSADYIYLLVCYKWLATARSNRGPLVCSSLQHTCSL